MRNTLYVVLIFTSFMLHGQVPWVFNPSSSTGIESHDNIAFGSYSIAMGYFSEARGDYSTAMGELTLARRYASTAMGSYTLATGDYSTAMGSMTEAKGDYSTAMGINTLAEGKYSTAMGHTNVTFGDYSTAMGLHNTPQEYGTTIIGVYSTIDATANRTNFDLSNRALVIGNGNPAIKSDAMTVLFDGTTNIAGDLTVNSDVRLKSNISSLGNTLPLIKMLDGKTYNLKNNESQEKIGLLAQDVQEIFPQLVREASDDQGTLSLNYQGLIPVLINAVNEQQEIIDKQQEQIDELKILIESLIERK